MAGGGGAPTSVTGGNANWQQQLQRDQAHSFEVGQRQVRRQIVYVLYVRPIVRGTYYRVKNCSFSAAGEHLCQRTNRVLLCRDIWPVI